jgi:hypothetical protein
MQDGIDITVLRGEDESQRQEYRGKDRMFHDEGLFVQS